MANTKVADLAFATADPMPVVPLDPLVASLLGRLDKVAARYESHVYPSVVRIERMALAAYGCLIAAFPHLDPMFTGDR